MLALEPDDGSIDRSLAALDGSIVAWVAGVHAAHETLAALSAQCDERARDDASATTDHADGPTHDQFDSPEVHAPAADSVPAKHAAVELFTTSEGSAGAAAGASASEPDRQRRPHERGEPEGSGSAPKTSPEDEALLATLDPEVAAAIRVKRRLWNNAKSVQALLDEYEPSQQEPKRRKRWWKRGNP